MNCRGEVGDGSLDESIGTGEYLDKNAMAAARNLVSSEGVNLRYLPVVTLLSLVQPHEAPMCRI